MVGQETFESYECLWHLSLLSHFNGANGQPFSYIDGRYDRNETVENGERINTDLTKQKNSVLDWI